MALQRCHADEGGRQKYVVGNGPAIESIVKPAPPIVR